MNSCILKAKGALIRENQFDEHTVNIVEIDFTSQQSVDLQMDQFVREQLNKDITNIFIPLSFGNVLTDFLGLRLATHIRCTLSSESQLANIYIYGALTLSEVPQENEFLRILFTRGTTLIDASEEELQKYAKISERLLTKEGLKKLLNTIHFDIPANFYDRHSIANIWGLFRLAQAAGIDINKINSLTSQQEKLSGIYFKWLLAKEQVAVSTIQPHKAAIVPITGDILLIDDEAERGWADLLKLTLNIPAQRLIIAANLDEAVKLLSSRIFQLIFLDLRLGEADHSAEEIEQMGGYKLLTNHIRNKIEANNFPTPVILLTASGKAWNISEMLNKGVDDYYIKEHPEQLNNKTFSRENYDRLLNGYEQLIQLGKRRREIWEMLLSIESLTNTKIKTANIKQRIPDKLKVGYGLLFRSVNQVEKDVLLFQNEIMAYIVFWSILEEISEEAFIRNGDYRWELKLRNGNLVTLQRPSPGKSREVKSRFITICKATISEETEPKKHKDIVNLSSRVAALLRYYANWDDKKVKNDFMFSLNKARNDIDFIHSTQEAIQNNPLITPQSYNDGYNNCKKMLQLLNTILFHLPK